MGVSAIHYVVHGVAVTENVKEYFQRMEDSDEYYDNPYKEEATPTKSGLHVIDDGMNGEYAVAGRILFKSQHGLPLKAMLKVPLFTGADHHRLREELRAIDVKYGTKYAEQMIQTLVFTHWH